MGVKLRSTFINCTVIQNNQTYPFVGFIKVDSVNGLETFFDSLIRETQTAKGTIGNSKSSNRFVLWLIERLLTYISMSLLSAVQYFQGLHLPLGHQTPRGD